MASDPIISKKTRNEFREVLTQRELRQIEMHFDVADIPPSDTVPAVSGQRRTLVERYYANVNFSEWRDVRKVLRVYEDVLDWLGEESESIENRIADWARKARNNLLKWLIKDGFALDQEGHIICYADSSHIPKLEEMAHTFDSMELRRQIERIKSSIEADPGLAIGSAKELLETTCKTILADNGLLVDEGLDVCDLVKQTRKVLKLMPDDIPATVKGADTIKKLLSNLATIAQGLSELRNFYGTGHGRRMSRGISARHARLAVGAATTLAVFLFETHCEVASKQEMVAD